MIDILGFKALLASVPVADIVARVDNLLGYIRGMRMYWSSAMVAGGTGAVTEKRDGKFGLNEMHFSDTILVWTAPCSDRNNPLCQIQGGLLVSSVARLICKSFLSGIPLRAGIGFGECYVDPIRNILVGQAIAEAHDVEAAQDWIGGAIHPNVAPTGVPGMGSIVEWDVPIKVNRPVRTQQALKWVDCTDEPSEDQLLKRTLESMLRANNTPDVQVKLENTKKFVEAIQGKLKYRVATASGVSGWFNPLDETEHKRAVKQAKRRRTRPRSKARASR